jgi:tetratricopeptide (TPR) repeat protein
MPGTASGYAHDHLGRHSEAIVCFQQALAINRRLGVRYSEAEALDHLGDAYCSSGDRAAAREEWKTRSRFSTPSATRTPSRCAPR